MKWTKAMIRSKIAYLDTITGLEGSELPIRFDESLDAVGHFGGLEGKERGFTFSRLYFQSPYFSKRMACETIMHEYAHYMNDVRGERPGHGEEWRACCRKIGLVDHFWLYQPRINAAYLAEEMGLSDAQHEERERRIEDLMQYHPGMAVTHPLFGRGVIVRTSGEGLGRRLTVRFGVEERLLSARWVKEHCAGVDEEAAA